MSDKQQDDYAKYKGDVSMEMNEMKALPDNVAQELAAHREFYKRDPKAAHYWDPVVIGVPGGPVKCLLLTFTGRKSGNELQTVLQYFEKDGKIAVVASRGGTEDHPVWYLNLLANPKSYTQVGERGYESVARTIDASERDAWLDVIYAEQPIQKLYQSRTTRLIPIVVLEEAAG